jgi:ribosome-binding factor A
MKSVSLRQKRIGRLLQETLGPLLIRELGGVTTGVVTVTAVDVPADLRSARVFLSVFGPDDPRVILDHLERRRGVLRRDLASAVKLKYNPQLIFALDPSADIAERIERRLQSVRTDEHDPS